MRLLGALNDLLQTPAGRWDEVLLHALVHVGRDVRRRRECP